MSRRKVSPLRLLGGAVLAILLGLPVALGLFRSERPLDVEAVTLARGPLTATLSHRGRLVSRDEVAVSSNVVGKVERVLVVEGQKVRRGQPLAILDARRVAAQVDSARSGLAEMQASLANARAQFDRAEALYRDQLISQAEYENRRTDWLLAKARVESAMAGVASQQKDLDVHTIRAPIDGVVTGLQAKEGSVVVVGSMNNPATVMLTIANLGKLEVELQMNEVDFGRTRLGMPASVRLPAFEGLRLQGRIHDYNVKALTRNQGWDDEETFVNVYVSLEDVPAFLKPGLTARVDLVLASAPDALSVPIEAVVERDPHQEAALSKQRRQEGEEASGAEAEADAGAVAAPEDHKEGVYVIDPSGRLRFVPVQVTVAGSEKVAIESPALRAGDRVVVGPFSILKTLHSGLPVKAKR